MLAPSAQIKPAADGNKKRPRWEVADVFSKGGATYRRAHSLTPLQLKVMNAIETCRTPVLGGHLDRCKNCGFERPAYNSCRNRHCPKCQTMAKQRWLEDRKAELLPVPYFHQVFTLPHELNALVLCNKRVLLNLLFRATSETLRAFGRRKFGGKIGFTLVLHTWDQRMHAHFHLHCVIPAGGLCADQGSWGHADPKFLFPVRALSRVFRGKFLSLLDRALQQGELFLPGELEELATAKARVGLLCRLRRKDWVVYSKRPFAGPEQVLEYLGRYTHRVAISNERILDVGDDCVRFRYRNRAEHDCPVCIETVGIEEFIRRFLLHVGRMISRASPTVASGRRVTGSSITPLAERLTLSTSRR